MSKLNRSLTTLLSSTYLGVNGMPDVVSGIAIKSTGDIYIVGHTQAADFPTITGAYDTTHNGYLDAFVSKFFLPNGQCVDSSLSISKITPEKGGDAGLVTVRIYGCNFQTGAVVKLIQDGQSDVVANAVSVYDNGKTVDATFDLTGKTIGVYRVVVTNPDSATITLPDAFTIEAVREPEFWADILGRPTVMGGRPAKFYLAYGNKGNVDAPGAVVWVRVPPGVGVNTGLSWDIDTDGNTVIQCVLSTILPGTTEMIPFTIIPPAIGHYPFDIEVSWITGPVDDGIEAPPVEVEIELVESTDSSFTALIHVVDTLEGTTGDISVNMILEDTTEVIDPTIEITETEDEIQYYCEATVEINDQTLAVSSPQIGYSTKASFAKTSKLTKIRINVPRRVERSFWQRLTDWLNESRGRTRMIERARDNAQAVQDALNNIRNATFEGSITCCLLKNGFFDQPRADTMWRMLDGNVAVQIVAGVIEEILSDYNQQALQALVDVMNNAWESHLCQAYNASPFVFMDKLGLKQPLQLGLCGAMGIGGNAELTRLIISYYFNNCIRCNQSIYQCNVQVQSQSLTQNRLEMTQSGEDSGLETCTAPQTGIKTSHHEALVSGDPNEKSGIQGTDERHYTSCEKPLEYTIYFENVGTATAAAQEITVTDQLGTSSVNLNTFGLGGDLVWR